MSSIQRLEQRQKEFEAEYDLLSEKISRLRKEKILETDINVRFKLETRLLYFTLVKNDKRMHSHTEQITFI